MNRKILIALGIIVLVQLACGPTIEVMNNTTEDVRVLITNSKQSLIISPQPGIGEKIDVNAGNYTASVISADIWINYAKSERDELMKMPYQSDKLNETRIKQIAERIRKIADNEEELFKSVTSQSTCKNSLTSEKNGRIDILKSGDSTLIIECKQVNASADLP